MSTCPIATYISFDANSGIHVARAPHLQMGRSDWTLLTTSVSPLASCDIYVATGQVQEYSAAAQGHKYQMYILIK
jgi:hypothetical protein